MGAPHKSSGYFWLAVRRAAEVTDLLCEPRKLLIDAHPSGAADADTRVHRALNGQHLSHTRGEVRRHALQFFIARLVQFEASLFAIAHELARDFVRIAKDDALF